MDSSHCKTFVDNIQTAFTTKMPPKSMLLQTEAGRSGGDLSAGWWSKTILSHGLKCVLVKYGLTDAKYCILGNSPHPSTPDEDEGQTELLIAEEKLSPEDDGQVMPR